MGALRLLLALSVVTAHMHGKGIFGLRLLYGNLAVQCFFMVSGFYMALVLTEKYNRPGDYLPFLWQRILRLFPAYFVIFLVTVVVEGLLWTVASNAQGAYAEWSTHGGIFSWWTRIELAAANLFIVGQQLTLFQAIDPTSGDLFFTGRFLADPLPASQFVFVHQAWTLDLEFAFYLIAPFLVRLAVRCQLLVFAVSVALRVGTSWMLDPNENPWHTDRFFPYELAFFMAGSIGYQIYRHQKALLARLNGFTGWFRWIFIALILFYSRLPGNSYTREAIFMPLLFLMIPLLFEYTKNNRFDRLVGELSYPLYLVHALVINLLRMFVPLVFPVSLQGPIYAVGAIAMAYLIYRMVDEKIDDFRHRLFARKHHAPSTAAQAPAPTSQLSEP